jgi:hypothetical protein
MMIVLWPARPSRSCGFSAQRRLRALYSLLLHHHHPYQNGPHRSAFIFFTCATLAQQLRARCAAVPVNSDNRDLRTCLPWLGVMVALRFFSSMHWPIGRRLESADSFNQVSILECNTRYSPRSSSDKLMATRMTDNGSIVYGGAVMVTWRLC